MIKNDECRWEYEKQDKEYSYDGNADIPFEHGWDAAELRLLTLLLALEEAFDKKDICELMRVELKDEIKRIKGDS